MHGSKRCLVTHRQVGRHTKSFQSGLHAALGDAPDIVLIGQLRDLETLAIAIETAEKEAYMKAVDTVQIVSSLQSRGIDTSFVE